MTVISTMKTYAKKIAVMDKLRKKIDAVAEKLEAHRIRKGVKVATLAVLVVVMTFLIYRTQIYSPKIGFDKDTMEPYVKVGNSSFRIHQDQDGQIMIGYFNGSSVVYDIYPSYLGWGCALILFVTVFTLVFFHFARVIFAAFVFAVIIALGMKYFVNRQIFEAYG